MAGLPLPKDAALHFQKKSTQTILPANALMLNYGKDSQKRYCKWRGCPCQKMLPYISKKININYPSSKCFNAKLRKGITKKILQMAGLPWPKDAALHFQKKINTNYLPAVALMLKLFVVTI